MVKKLSSIITVLALCIVMSYLGGRIFIRQCNCSGIVHIVNTVEIAGMHHASEDCCASTDTNVAKWKHGDTPELTATPCMKLLSMSLSPTVPAHNTVWLFFVHSANLFFANGWNASSPIWQTLTAHILIPQKIPIPPKLHLSLKRCLLI